MQKKLNILLLFLIIHTTFSWAWNPVYLIGDPTGAWTKNSSYVISNGGDEGSLDFYFQQNQYFTTFIDFYNEKAGPSANGAEMSYDAVNAQKFYIWADGENGNAAKFTGSTGVITVHARQKDNGDDQPWIWLTRPTIKYKHPWDGGDWYEKTATDNNDGTYTLRATYRGEGANVGPAGNYKYFSSPSLVGNPVSGNTCTFVWDANGYKGVGTESENKGTMYIISDVNSTISVTTYSIAPFAGDGSSANPYQVFSGKSLYLQVNTSPAIAKNSGIYFKFGDNEQYYSINSDAKYTISNVTNTEKQSIEVQVYYKNGRAMGKAVTTTVYYKAIPAPTISLTTNKDNVEKHNTGDEFTLTTTITNVPNPGSQSITYNHKAPGAADYSDNFTNIHTPSVTFNGANYSTTGTAQFTASISYGNYTWTSEPISVYAYEYKLISVYDPLHYLTPDDGYIHCWNNNNLSVHNAEYPGELLSGVSVKYGDWWLYGLKYPMYDYIQLDNGKNEHGQDKQKTVDIAISDHTCLEITGYSGNTWTHSIKNDCLPTLYRLKIERSNGHHNYSNPVAQENDILSFFADGSCPHIYWQQYTGTWKTLSTEVSTRPTSGNVYNATFSGSPTSTLTLTAYTGPFYIRTNEAPGKWHNYKVDGNKFTKFVPNPLFPNENYNHYWCAYLQHGKNVQACIGNDYNESLASLIGADEFTTGEGNIPASAGGKDIAGANVRFAYNNETNFFSRTLIGGSGDANQQFLTVYGVKDNADNNYVFSNDAGTIPITKASAIKFSDMSNWVYQADVYAKVLGSDKEDARVVVNANFNNHNQDLAGSESVPVKVLGKNSTSGDVRSIRLIYDYKMNRLVAAWIPKSTEDIDANLSIDANLLIKRVDNGNTQQIGIKSNSVSVSNIDQIFYTLEIPKTGSWTTNGGFYWFSLPYACNISEIFGFPGAYKEKWEIQRYRGDLRAANGLHEGETYWRTLKETATLEAHRGYLLYVHPTDADFSTIEIGGKTVSSLQLYFPSSSRGFNLTSDYGEITVPLHECEIAGRENEDSNWNLLGIPAYNNVNLRSSGNTTSQTIGKNAPKFLYTWSAANGGTYNVSASDEATFNFQPFMGYMVQFGGTIDWSQYTQLANPAAVPGRRKAADAEHIDHTMTLSLLSESEEVGNDELTMLDRTYIRLYTDATADYDLNMDLGKIMTENVSQIYTILEGGSPLAANNIPPTTTTLVLGVQTAKADAYTFHMDNLTLGARALLTDNETSITTDLGTGDYQVDLTTGTYEGRFTLQIIVDTNTIGTDLKQASTSDAATKVSKVMIDGQLYIISNGHVYNVMGAEVK